MKTLIKTLFFLLITTTTFAQTPAEKFQAAVGKGLQQLSAAKTSADFLQTSNYFDRIAQAESKEWLPPYYASYTSLVAGLTTEDKALQDQYFDSALKKAEAADLISKNNSEIYVLKGYIQFMKMSIDPQSRMSYMSLSATSLETAKALNPENPRIYLIHGQNTFYTPEAFGGGPVKAKALLETAAVKFASFKPANALEPGWGAAQAASLLEKCK